MDNANRFYTIRKKKGLTSKELARRAGISPSFLCDIEKNRATPSLQVMVKLSDVLGVSVSYLTGEHEIASVIPNAAYQALQQLLTDDTGHDIIQLLSTYSQWNAEERMELRKYLEIKRLIRTSDISTVNLDEKE